MDKMESSRRNLLKGMAGAGAMVSQVAIPIAAFATGSENALKKAVKANHAVSVKRLQDWIALPSIAAENLNYPAGAEYLAKLATEAGFQHVELIPTDGKPAVFGTLDAGAKKTLVLNFMYDVKQFDPSEWSSPPLEARIVDRPGLGKVMIGRGAKNQKGPEAALLAAIHAYKTAGIKLPVNLVLIAEGEEEIASPHFMQFITTPKVLEAVRRSSGVLNPNGSQEADGFVRIQLGAKGALEFQLIVDGAKWRRGPMTHEVHSSEKARLDSAPWHLVGALSTLVSPDGNKVLIDGLPEMVAPLTARQKELIALSAKGMSEAQVKKELGVDHWIDDMSWEESLIRLAQEPTVNIQGLVAGYQGPGGKSILPSSATAKLEMRLVPNMTKVDTIAKLRAHLDKRGFQDVELKVTGGYGPNETDENADVIRAAKAVYDRAGVKYSVYPRGAGSWPGVYFTAPPVSRPVVVFGLGYGGAIHAPNEFYLIESSNPAVAGWDEAVYAYADFLQQFAAA